MDRANITDYSTRSGMKVSAAFLKLHRDILAGSTDEAISTAYDLYRTSAVMLEELWKQLELEAVYTIGLAEQGALAYIYNLRCICYHTEPYMPDAGGMQALSFIQAIRYLCGCEKEQSLEQEIRKVQDCYDAGVYPVIPAFARDHHNHAGRELGHTPLDFLYPDEGKGSVFIVSNVDGLLPEIKAMMAEMLLAVILIIVFTDAILMMWVYSSVVHPLGRLQEATKKIRDGNLDFALEVENDDEIGQLCQDFEEMRMRLKENAEEKIQYDKENKELISNISHDLKTPITAIKGYVEGIMDGVASSPEKLDRYIRTIYNKANDMDKLIDELTFYSKIDTNKIPYTFSKINVASYFRDCVDEVGLEMEARNIELGYFNYVDEDVMVIADAEQMRRVINNIVSNSVKYIDKKNGIINIRIRRGRFYPD